MARFIIPVISLDDIIVSVFAIVVFAIVVFGGLSLGIYFFDHNDKVVTLESRIEILTSSLKYSAQTISGIEKRSRPEKNWQRNCSMTLTKQSGLAL
jgi:hypothetical protein